MLLAFPATRLGGHAHDVSGEGLAGSADDHRAVARDDRRDLYVVHDVHARESADLGQMIVKGVVLANESATSARGWRTRIDAHRDRPEVAQEVGDALGIVGEAPEDVERGPCEGGIQTLI